MRHSCNRPGVLVRGVHEHHTGHLAWVRVVIQADDVATERMAHEHKRRLHAGVTQEDMKITRGGIAPVRVRAGITPTERSPVVPAGAGERGDLALRRRPDVPGRRMLSKMTLGLPSPRAWMLSVRPPTSTGRPTCCRTRLSRHAAICSYEKAATTRNTTIAENSLSHRMLASMRIDRLVHLCARRARSGFA